MKNKIKFEKIAIIGLGLIGSSLALAIKKHKFPHFQKENPT